MDKRLLAITVALFASITLTFGAGSPYAVSFDAGSTSHGVSNALTRSFPNVLGTHESAIIWNGTNTVAGGGKHITVTSGTATMTSSDGAFTGMQPGENIEFTSGNPLQMCIIQVIDANTAIGYQVNANGFTIPFATQNNVINWICRPRPVRWTDDVTGIEERGGFFDCNGALWMYGIGDQAEVNFLSTSKDGTMFTTSMAPGGNFGYSSQAAWTLSSATTNQFSPSLLPYNIVTVSGWSPGEAIDVDDVGKVHLQYGLAGWHANPLVISNAVINYGVASLASNAPVVINPTGTTNTFFGNARAFLNVTNAAYVYVTSTAHPLTPHSGIYTSSVMNACIMVTLQPGEAVTNLSGLSGKMVPW